MRPRGRGVLPPHPPEVSVSPPRTGNVNERCTKRFDKSDDSFHVGKILPYFFRGNGKRSDAFSTIITIILFTFVLRF